MGQGIGCVEQSCSEQRCIEAALGAPCVGQCRSLAPTRACGDGDSDRDKDSEAGDGKLDVSTFLDEEIPADGSVMATVDYARFSTSANASSSRAKTSSCRPLFPPGSLVPYHVHTEVPLGVDERLEVSYDLDQKPLGYGSYGSVIAATHRRTGVRRAVKAVEKAKLARYVRDVSAFVRREADLIRRCDHPNVVKLYEVFETEERLFLILELLEGGDVLERVTVARERLPDPEAATLFAQMLRAVQHISSKGIIHRDLKPENFMFPRQEQASAPLLPHKVPVKLIDFGLSRRLDSDAALTAKMGTIEYMAPEVYSGCVERVYADRVDMWSMGVVLHVIFTGYFPLPKLQEESEEYFSKPHWRNVSSLGRDLLTQLLRANPNQRPPVGMALRHPWITTAAYETRLPMLRSLPSVVRCFAACSDVKQLALAALAREVDDTDCSTTRSLFLTLEHECGGAVTQLGLQKVARFSGPLGILAAELMCVFHDVDLDGSGVIEWTKFLAVFITGKSLETSVRLEDGQIWSAFDLLSNGTGFVSEPSLARVQLAAKRQRPEGMQVRQSALLAAVPSGVLARPQFMSMLRSNELP